MKIEPLKWNVVIPGHWNRAILTPSGIVRRLFKLPDGTGMTVQVPVDGLGPYRVGLEGLAVIVEEGRLTIETETPDYELLYKAFSIGRDALADLPETPVSAAGFNLRYTISDYPPELSDLFHSPIDSRLHGTSYDIASRTLLRSLRFGQGPFHGGVLNLRLDLEHEDGTVSLALNFHRDSKDTTELSAWLGIPRSALENEVRSVLSKVADTDLEE